MPYSLPPPDAVRRTAQDVVGQRRFNLDTDREVLTNRLLDAVERFFGWLGELLDRAVKPLGNLIDTNPLLGWLIVGLLALVLFAAVGHILYTVVVTMRDPSRGRRRYAVAEADRLRPETWERLALEARARGDFIGAVRCLFRAGLMRLESARKQSYRAAWTNQEYLRRYQRTPAFDLLAPFVEVIDGKWYAGADCSDDDYERCAAAHAGLLNLAQEMAHAQGA